MRGKWWGYEITVTDHIVDHRVVGGPYLYHQPVDAAGDAAEGVGREVLYFYFHKFCVGDRVYDAGGGADRAVVPFVSR
jgi:hypothetical protein